ncbi:hypothetical protein GPX89_08750 [Nocardia sp. ET3-3]|uniref:Uncharacterized protein n=1 Tax=Nocardia terrae TaxID=2675851 RepID=A0A7K1USM2_9NOCA|nr:hypothetical protein [Nocardia terrae]MVU77334.1 hypothetical protein [Nocardia terrae]
MIYPDRESAARVAELAGIVHESWMQDWPIEVSDQARLDEFIGLLLANKAEWELSFWLVDLVLESAEDDLAITPVQHDQWERTEPLVGALVAVWDATHAPGIALRLEYWACLGASAPEEMFLVSPLVREARRRIGHSAT